MKRLNACLILTIISLQVLAGDAAHFAKRAQEKFKNRDYAGAIVDYSRAIAIDSTSAPLFNNRGLCKYKLRRFEEALWDYNKALSLDSTMANAHFNKGNCLTAVVQYEQAISSFDHAIDCDSTFRKAYINRAKVLFYLEDYRSCIRDYNRAVRMGNFEDKVVFLQRGNAYYMIREYQLALADYTKSLAIDPEYYKAYINRGICKLDMGNIEGAIQDFTLSIRYNEFDGESYYYRAMANVHRMHELSSNYEAGDQASIAEFKIYNELACSDIKKAIAFGYAAAFELEEKYCKK